ncbi:hypothetical protein ACFX2B_024478 [Malus domestica]
MVVHEEVLQVIQTFRAPPLTLLSVSSSFLSLQVANMAELVELPISLSILRFRNKILLPSAIIRICCTSPNRCCYPDNVENVKALLEVEKMKYTVMTGDEQILSLNIDPHKTVENVKALLKVETWVLLQRQQLLYNGREMRNFEMLSTLGVRDEDFIMIVSNATSRYT